MGLSALIPGYVPALHLAGGGEQAQGLQGNRNSFQAFLSGISLQLVISLATPQSSLSRIIVSVTWVTAH